MKDEKILSIVYKLLSIIFTAVIIFASLYVLSIDKVLLLFGIIGISSTIFCVCRIIVLKMKKTQKPIIGLILTYIMFVLWIPATPALLLEALSRDELISEFKSDLFKFQFVSEQYDMPNDSIAEIYGFDCKKI